MDAESTMDWAKGDNALCMRISCPLWLKKAPISMAQNSNNTLSMKPSTEGGGDYESPLDFKQ